MAQFSRLGRLAGQCTKPRATTGAGCCGGGGMLDSSVTFNAAGGDVSSGFRGWQQLGQQQDKSLGGKSKDGSFGFRAWQQGKQQDQSIGARSLGGKSAEGWVALWGAPLSGW
jgi:hypothetical protein